MSSTTNASTTSNTSVASTTTNSLPLSLPENNTAPASVMTISVVQESENQRMVLTRIQRFAAQSNAKILPPYPYTTSLVYCLNLNLNLNLILGQHQYIILLILILSYQWARAYSYLFKSRTSTTSAAGRQASGSNSGGQSSALASGSNQVSVNILIVVDPAPLHGYQPPPGADGSPRPSTGERDTVRFTSGDASSQKPNTLIHHANTMHLLTMIKKTVLPHAIASRDIHDALSSLFQMHSLSFPPLEVAGTLPWTLLIHNTKDKQSSWAPLCSMREPVLTITWGQVMAHASKFPIIHFQEEDHSIIFVAPVDGPVIGPLNSHGHHYCLSQQLWHGLQTPDLDEDRDLDPPDCEEWCGQGEELIEGPQGRDSGIVMASVQENEQLNAHGIPNVPDDEFKFDENLDQVINEALANLRIIEGPAQPASLQITSDSEEDAAKALEICLRSICFGTPLPSGEIPLGTIVHHFSPDVLSKSHDIHVSM
ncbi:hypothetical protein H1R20_g13730, partial [Candolleomyces eurysporus]